MGQSSIAWPFLLNELSGRMFPEPTSTAGLGREAEARPDHLPAEEASISAISISGKHLQDAPVATGQPVLQRLAISVKQSHLT
jgi:hypothetical protein